MKKQLSITIGWLYPDLMSTYGDRGNIIVLTKRCEWRGIEVVVKRIGLDSPTSDIKGCDLLFMGGAQDRQQTIVSDDLRKKARVLGEMIERGIPGLYICGAFQFLGKYYKEADGTVVDGLGILDLYTENPGHDAKRLIGNVVIELSSDILKLMGLPRFAEDKGEARNDVYKYVVGFENHGGRTYLGEKVKPLGKVVKGFGNNGEDGFEGAMYKNSLGSYFHGPILPKNPHLADYLIEKALEMKYEEKVALVPLDDSLEKQAHLFMVKRGVEAS